MHSDQAHDPHKEALQEARFLSALATQLEESLKKELGK
jgi:hypothetical protein